MTVLLVCSHLSIIAVCCFKQPHVHLKASTIESSDAAFPNACPDGTAERMFCGCDDRLPQWHTDVSHRFDLVGVVRHHFYKASHQTASQEAEGRFCSEVLRPKPPWRSNSQQLFARAYGLQHDASGHRFPQNGKSNSTEEGSNTSHAPQANTRTPHSTTIGNLKVFDDTTWTRQDLANASGNRTKA